MILELFSIITILDDDLPGSEVQVGGRSASGGRLLHLLRSHLPLPVTHIEVLQTVYSLYIRVGFLQLPQSFHQTLLLAGDLAGLQFAEDKFLVRHVLTDETLCSLGDL